MSMSQVPGAHSKPLSGVRVLDLGWVWAGPMAAAFLADLGAEVIKIEHSERLDNSRLRGAPIVDGKKLRIPGKSIELVPLFHNLNRHKLSARLNIRDERGADLFRQLAAKSDVVLENFTPGTLAALGLDYAALAREHGELIMISLSTAGQFGPIADLRGYAPVISAYSGLEALIGYENEAPSGMMNFGLNDSSSGIHALFALLAALWHREQTGQGQYIDLSQMEVGTAPLAEAMLDFQFSGKAPNPTGNGHRRYCPHGIFPCAGEDSWVAISVEDDGQWPALCMVIGENDWAHRADLVGHAGRMSARAAIEARLAAWTAGQSRESVLAELVPRGVPATPVLSIEEQFEDAHYVARGVRQVVSHPIMGEELLYRLPWQMSGTDLTLSASSPELGAHDAYVYGQILGLDAQSIERLREEKVIY